MSDRSPLTARDLMEREQARLLEEAAAQEAAAKEAAAKAAAIARDMAELDRLTSKYNLVLGLPGASADAGSPARESMSISGLIAAYKSNPNSTYQKLRHRTRENYDSLLRRIIKDHGETKLADLRGPEIQSIHDGWSDGGKKIPMAHGLITMLRTLIGFGWSVLDNRECERLSVVLHKMHFPMPRSKTELPMTAEYATWIREEARRKKLPSIALAQAFQFDCMLHQKDVIGEWVPMSELGGGPFGVIDHDTNMKWLRGIRWEKIDENLILSHVTSSRQRSVEKDLKLAPMVLEELKATYCKHGEPLTRAKLPPSGAIIVFEKTKRPYLMHTFRREWRKIARAARVPDGVKNRDSRIVVPAGKSDEPVRAVR